MAVDVRDFVSRPDSFEGLYRDADIVQRNRQMNQETAFRKDQQKASNTQRIMNYLDPKDYLTGTDYDPKVVEDINGALQEAISLTENGADISTVMMAITPKVAKISEYSQKAKMINANLKKGAEVLKSYKGYNVPAIEQEARKTAFYNQDGTLRDLSEVDPNADWITETVKTKPWAVTTGAGLDDFAENLPLEEFQSEVMTSNRGINRKVRVGGKKAFYEDYARNEKGEIMLDANGNPVGLDILGSDPIRTEDGKGFVTDESGKPARSMDRAAFLAIMQQRPDVADYVRGQVQKFYEDAGQTAPNQNQEAWENTARMILAKELRTRKKSTFRTLDEERKIAKLQAAEAGLQSGRGGGSGGGANTVSRLPHPFDDFKFTAEKGKYKIENGIAMDKDGNKVTATFTIQPDQVPASVIAAINKSGAGDKMELNVPFKVIAQDGEIISVFPQGDGGKDISRRLANIGYGNLDTSPKEYRSTAPMGKSKPQGQTKQQPKSNKQQTVGESGVKWK